MTHELKPCPFCGEGFFLRLEEHMSPDGSCREGWIECQNCGARGQTEYGRCAPDEMERLIYGGWNERARTTLQAIGEDNAQ